MSKVTVKYNDKPVIGEEIAPGVVKRAGRKGAKTFLVKCSVTGDWCYSSAERLNKLVEKHGSVETVGLNYLSRPGKAILKAKEPAKPAKPKQAGKVKVGKSSAYIKPELDQASRSEQRAAIREKQAAPELAKMLPKMD